MTDTPSFHDTVETLRTELNHIPTTTPAGEPIISNDHKWDIKNTISRLHLSVFDSDITDDRSRVIIEATDLIEDVLTKLTNTYTLTEPQQQIVENLSELTPAVRSVHEYEQLNDDYRTRIEEHGLKPDIDDFQISPPDTDLDSDEKAAVVEAVGNAAKADCEHSSSEQ